MTHFERITEETWRRIGKFTVLDSERTAEQLATLFAVMQNFVVVRAEYDFSWGGIEYSAISPLFDPVPEGMRPPHYEILVTYLPNGGHTIQVKKETS